MSATVNPTMEWSPQLLEALGVRVTRLVTDSRQVQPGDTFVAYPGGQVDGRNFIAQAIAAGANAVIWDAEHFHWNPEWKVPHLAVRELRRHAGAIADQVYAQPSEKLWMVGVTGTNGKTSCSHWLAQSFSALGRKAALIGTLGNGFPGALQATVNTTPDAIRVHGLLAEYVKQEAEAVAMEVSSHALEQGRVNGVRFDVALLTNLSRDHLDYHGDMSHYAAAKRKLFDWHQLKHAVVNLDDAFGCELAEQLQDAEVETIAYGLTEQALRKAEKLGVRMVYGSDLNMDAQGMRLQVRSSWGSGELNSSLLGRFNAANLLGALAVLLVSGVSLEAALRQLGTLRAVAGRMQSVGGNGMPAVVVDYAHTPDALEKVLDALRELTQPGGGKVICVFGCGGDRDRGKRPMMGKVAAQRADISIITSDNPRSEDPQDIIAAILPGVREGAAETGSRYEVVGDRAQAIAQAICMAEARDTVLVAGKGHEDYQEINGVKHEFSDVAEAKRALHAWRSGVCA